MRRWRRLMGMKQILVMMAAVVLVGCSNDTRKAAPDPADEKLITDPIVEEAVRESLEKPEGILTVADLEKVTSLRLPFRQITNVGLKEVAKLQNLEKLYLVDTKVTTFKPSPSDSRANPLMPASAFL